VCGLSLTTTRKEFRVEIVNVAEGVCCCLSVLARFYTAAPVLFYFTKRFPSKITSLTVPLLLHSESVLLFILLLLEFLVSVSNES
jgi:hypothetical protein